MILLPLIFVGRTILAIVGTDHKKSPLLILLLLSEAAPSLAAVEFAAAPQFLGGALDHQRFLHHVRFLTQQRRLRGRLFRLRGRFFGFFLLRLRGRRRGRLVAIAAGGALAAAADGGQRRVGREVGGGAWGRGGGQVRGAAQPRVPPPEQLGQQPARRRPRLLLAHREARALGRAAAKCCTCGCSCGWRLRPADRRQVKRLRRRLGPNFLGLRMPERAERNQCSRVFQQWGLRCSWLTASRVICGPSPTETVFDRF
jgi:hypothetical protein